MRYILFFALLSCTLMGVGQTRPSGFPAQKTTTWHQFGYVGGDSGVIAAKRDTSSWLPRFSGTIVMRPQDRNLYWYDSAALKWNRIARFGDTAGTAVIWGNVSGDITNQTDLYDSLLVRFKQNGNSFGDTGRLGTNDNYPLLFKTNNVSRGIVTTSGRFGIKNIVPQQDLDLTGTFGLSLMGYPSVLNDGAPAVAYIVHGGGNYGLNVTRAANDAGAANFSFYKTRSTDASVSTSLQKNDLIGRTTYQGVDGSNVIRATADHGVIADTVNSTIVGGHYYWNLHNLAGASVEKMRLDYNGLLTVAGRGLYTDTLTATTMGDADSSNRVASTAWVKRQGYGTGSSGVTNVESGFGLTGGPITSTGTLEADTARGSGIPSYFYVDSIAATIPTPTLQSVTDAGNTTTNPIYADSVLSRSISADSNLYVPIRAAMDTFSTSVRRGDIWFDTTTNSMMYRDTAFWTYFSSLANSLIPNRPNMRLIAGVFRPTVVGSDITWDWIINATHDSIGFGPITCNGTDVVLSLQEEAAKIHTIVIVPDEALAASVDVGCSFQTTQALVRIYRRFGVKNTILRGNGTTYAKSDGGGGTFTMSYGSGDLRIDWNNLYTSAAFGLAATYVGTNGYHLERQASGLSGFDARYLIKDMFGNTVTENPTSSDAIDIVVPEWGEVSINPCVAGGDGWAAATFTEFSNIWVFGLIEL